MNTINEFVSTSVRQLRDNLDGLDEETLYQLGLNTGNHSVRAEAREVFPDQPKGYVRAFCLLRRYAAIKSSAMAQRSRGQINVALAYEAECDKTYRRLPEFAKFF